MGYYLQDNPNKSFGQFGWPRTKVSGAIGVHTAENNTDFDGADPGAEDVASWLTRRADPGSYHAIADADSRIKLIHPRYAAWADTTNNAHAMSVSGAMQAARWRELSPARAAAITRNMAYAAAELVQDAIDAGLLSAPVPARRITAAEAVAGTRAGFYGHGETNPGRRYDPGQNFDWDLFLQTYASAVGGHAAAGIITPQSTTTPPEEDDMFTDQDRADLARTKELLLSFQAAITDPVTGYVGHAALAVLRAGAATQYVKGDAEDTIYAREANGVLRGITKDEWDVASAAGEKFVQMPQGEIDEAKKVGK